MAEVLTKTVILPDGHRINLDNVADYSLSGSVITFTRPDSSTYTYTDPAGSDTGAAYTLAQLDYASAYGAIASNNQVGSSPYTITSISPDPFDISNPGSGTITITGSGFTTANIGLMRFEDAGGRLDSNGYAWTCTYVSPTKMTAVFDTTGDSVTSSNMLIYYQDANGLVSNVLNGALSGTVITI